MEPGILAHSHQWGTGLGGNHPAKPFANNVIRTTSPYRKNADDMMLVSY